MNFELEIIRNLQSQRSNFLDLFFITVSFLGSFIGFLILLFVFYRVNRKFGFIFCITYLFNVFITNVVLKNVICRHRPFMDNRDIINIGGGDWNFSMPSGHAVSVTVMAIFLIYFIIMVAKNRNFKIIGSIVCFLFDILVCLSRMYLGKHYLTDLIFGVFIASIISGLALYYFHKKHLKRIVIYIKKKE